MRHASRLRLAVVGAVVLAGGVLTALAVRPQRAGWWTDGDAIRVAEGLVPVREVLWRPAELVRGEGLGTTDVYEPRVSADGASMVFVRNRPGQNADLYTARWAHQGWSEAVPIEAINSPDDELGPELSRDGESLYFYSNRAGGLGGYDLWVSRLHDGRWQTPINAGPTINSRWNEYGPALSPSGERLYFSSNRPRPGETVAQDEAWNATVREHRTRHDYDLYVAELGSTEGVRALVELNTASDEGAPAMSPAGDFLYFASDRPGGLGGFDLLRVRVNREGRVGGVENLGNGINSAHNDLDPALSADGFSLTFSSDRSVAGPNGGDGVSGWREPGRYSLWNSTSVEVYRELEIGESGLAGMWRRLWPLLLLLVALMPLVLLYRFVRDQKWRQRFVRLSLLAKCLLISVFVHAGIASGLAVWKVGAGFIEGMQSGGGTRVVLTSGAAGDAIAGQIRSTSIEGSRALPEIVGVAMPALGEPLEVDSVLTDLPELVVGAMPVVSPPALRASGEDDQYIADPMIPTSQAEVPVSVPAVQAARVAGGEESIGTTQPLWSPMDVAIVGKPECTTITTMLPAPLVGHNDGQAAPVPVAPPETLRDARVVSDLAGGQQLPSLQADVSLPLGSLAKRPAVEAGARSAVPVDHASIPSDVIVSDLPSRVVDVPLGVQGGRSGERNGLVVEAPVLDWASSSSGHERGTSIVGSSVPVADGDKGTSNPLGRVPEVVPKTARSTAEPDHARAGGREAAFAPPGMLIDSQQTSRASVLVSPRPQALSGAGEPMTRLALPAAGLARDRSAERENAGPPIAALPGPRQGAEEIPVGIPVPVETFAQRDPKSRGELVERMGGSVETEKAVGLALEWFMRHQARDGHWSAEHYDQGCGRCEGAAEFEADAAMTGMVLLCYLGAGHTHVKDGPYKEVVQKGLTWLVNRQGSDGDLRQGETMYGQTAATVALCEAFAMTQDPKLAEPARKAVEFVLARAARQGASSGRDTSVLGWLVFTVESARRAGFAVPQTTFDSARHWLEHVAEAGSPGRYAYTRGGRPSAAMTAEAMFVRQLLGHNRDEAMMQQSAGFVLGTLPKWREGAPTYYWYYATLALFQHQGDAWKQWNEALVTELLAHQEQTGQAAGSWATTDQWSRMGGRVYQTAVCTLSLEVYYRYKAK